MAGYQVLSGWSARTLRQIHRKNFIPFMSEHITHIAVFEDSFRLAVALDDVAEAFKQSVRNYPDQGMLGSASRGNHLYALPVIEACRRHWQRSTWTPQMEQQLAYAVGWISHRAADLQMKPLSRGMDPSEAPRFTSTENQIYQDAVTFRQVYQGGRVSSLSPRAVLVPATLEKELASAPGSAMMDAAAAEWLMVGYVQSGLLAQQEFRSQQSDLDAWVDTLLERQQKLSEPLDVYVNAFQTPAPDKEQRYIASVNYYDPDDALIRLARAAQRGEVIAGPAVDQALATADQQSQYARALRRGCDFLRSATRYFNEEIDQPAAIRALEI